MIFNMHKGSVAQSKWRSQR